MELGTKKDLETYLEQLSNKIKQLEQNLTPTEPDPEPDPKSDPEPDPEPEADADEIEKFLNE